MSDTILHKRSLTSGSLPTTASLKVGELAINVPDGKLFLRSSGSNSDEVRSALIIGSENEGDVSLIGQISASRFSGSFVGDGNLLVGIVSASYALTASFALNAGSGGSIVTIS